MINKNAVEAIKKQKNTFVALIIITILLTGMIIAQAYGLTYIINKVFLQNNDLNNLHTALILLIGVIILRTIFTFMQEKIAQKLAYLTKKSIREKVVKHMLDLGPIKSQNSGDTIHLITDGLDSVESYIARYLPQMAYAILIPVFMAVAMIVFVPWVGILLILTYPLIPFFMILIGKKAGKMNEEQWSRMSFLSGHFLDVLQGLGTLKIFNRSKEQKFVIARLAGEFRDSTLRVLRIAFLSSFVLELISTISTAMIAVYTGVALLFGEIDFTSAFFVLLLAPEFYLPLRELGSAFHTGMAGEVALKKADEFLAIKPFAESKGQHKINDISAVTFQNVSFGYTENKEVLHDINLSLNTDSPVMLVGESGAGKTTIANILLGLLQAKGKVEIITKDGNTFNIQEINIHDWRNNIAVVTQKPYIFRDTILNNIAFGRNVSEAEIIEACKKAQAHEFIMSHPAGYNRILGEGGRGLSGGQIQRLAIARAFLSKASIVILDEVSAHLDLQTQEELAKSIKELIKNKIALFIGHRVETMQWAKTLYVMKDGSIVQSGSYQELLNEKGYFRDLLELGGIIDE